MFLNSKKALEMRDRYYRREKMLRRMVQTAETIPAANHYTNLLVKLVFGPWRDLETRSPRAG